MTGRLVTAKTTGFQSARTISPSGLGRLRPGMSALQRRANLTGPPLKRVPIALPAALQGVGTRRTPLSVAKGVQRLARMLGIRPRLHPAQLGAEFALRGLEFFYKRTFPSGFPGWDAITASWTSGAQHGLHNSDPGDDLSPGDYTANGFDQGPYAEFLTDGLIDLNDGSGVTGYRYWGHFHSQPQSPETMDPKPLADDWPAVAQPYPMPRAPAAPGIVVDPGSMPIRVHPAPRPARAPRPWRDTQAVVFSVTSRPNGAERVSVARSQKRTRPDRKTDEHKARPALGLAYAILDALASTSTEAADIVTLLADLSHYHPDSMMLPEEMRGHESFRAKLYFLFVVGGINYIEFDELYVGLLEMEAEDTAYGHLGRLGAQAGEGLGMLTGPQAGPVL